MIKFVSLLKRRPGMSFEEFVTYYETRHAVLGAEHLPGAQHYERRFLRPVPHPIDGSLREDYDCITELWFDDREAMEKSFAHLGEPDIAALFAEDEEKLFDRSRSLCYVVDREHLTKA